MVRFGWGRTHTCTHAQANTNTPRFQAAAIAQPSGAGAIAHEHKRIEALLATATRHVLMRSHVDDVAVREVVRLEVPVVHALVQIFRLLRKRETKNLKCEYLNSHQ